MSQDIKIRVKNSAINKFIRFGYRKVTTDEIAKDLGISKRTLYEHFSSKEEIVKSIIIDEMTLVEKRIFEICNDSEKSIIQKLITLFTIPRKISDKSNFELFRDLRNEIPEVMQIMEKYEISINKMIISLYTQGQEAGYLRKDIDPVLILRFGRTFKDKFDMSDFEGIGNYTKYDLFKSFHKLFIQGVLSKKAIAQHYEEIELLLEEV